MLPTKLPPRSSALRDLIDRVGSALFDGEDDSPAGTSFGPAPRETGTPRQQYVRHFANRWASFHQDSRENPDNDSKAIALVFLWGAAFIIPLIYAGLRWLVAEARELASGAGNAHASGVPHVHLPAMSFDGKAATGIILIAATGILWFTRRSKKKPNE